LGKKQGWGKKQIKNSGFLGFM